MEKPGFWLVVRDTCRFSGQVLPESYTVCTHCRGAPLLLLASFGRKERTDGPWVVPVVGVVLRLLHGSRVVNGLAATVRNARPECPIMRLRGEG